MKTIVPPTIISAFASTSWCLLGCSALSAAFSQCVRKYPSSLGSERIAPFRFPENEHSSYDVASLDSYTRTNSQLKSSFFLVVSIRRASLLMLSIVLVNIFRTNVLRIPKRKNNFFDECPWPFTLFHDPKKFMKDSTTSILVVWIALCQLYSLCTKTRAAIPFP